MLESIISTREKLSRMELRSPVDGAACGFESLRTRCGDFFCATNYVCYPTAPTLVVSARVETIHIDRGMGQDVSLRFTAFDQRQTPDFGQVARYRLMINR